MLKLGNQIIAQTEKLGLVSDLAFANSAIILYSRCGRIEARNVFNSIDMKNLISFNVNCHHDRICSEWSRLESD